MCRICCTLHPPENVVLHHLDPGPVAPEAAAAPDPGLPAVAARHGRGELLAQAGVAPGEQLPGEGVGTGLGGQLPAACRGVDIAGEYSLQPPDNDAEVWPMV